MKISNYLGQIFNIAEKYNKEPYRIYEKASIKVDEAKKNKVILDLKEALNQVSKQYIRG